MVEQRTKKETKSKKRKLSKARIIRRKPITSVKISNKTQENIAPKITISRNMFALMLIALVIAFARKYSYYEDGAVILLSLLTFTAILVLWYYIRLRIKRRKQKRLDKKFMKVNEYLTKHFLKFMLISSIGLVVLVLLGVIIFRLISK